MLGAHNFEDPLEHGRISSGVRKVKVHPDWTQSDFSSNNDLAILELVDDIQFNRMIRPVCLPNEINQSYVDSSDDLIAVGWGTTNYARSSRVPIKVDFFPVERSRCYEKSNKRDQQISTHAQNSNCVKVEGRSGTCGIDDGTGIYQENEGKFYIKGIMSSEVDQNCTRNKFIAVADIAQNIDFVTRESGLQVR